MRGSRKGFSLLEVMVALTILAMSFPVIFGAMSNSLRAERRTGESERRLLQARNKLAELDLLESIRPHDRARGSFEDGTRWQVETFPFVEPFNEGRRSNPHAVVRAVLTLEWDGRNGTRRWEIETYRFVPATGQPIRGLEEQLREIR